MFFFMLLEFMTSQMWSRKKINIFCWSNMHIPIWDTFLRALSSKSSKLVFRFSSSLLPPHLHMKRLENLLGKDILLVGMFPSFTGEKMWKMKPEFRMLFKGFKKEEPCPFQVRLLHNVSLYHFKLKISCITKYISSPRPSVNDHIL